MRKWTPFKRGAIAGAISLTLGFVLRIGGFAPYPPESAIELFVRYIPASLEQPAIQALGDLALRVGLLVASIVVALGYGIFGLFFEAVYANLAPRLIKLSRYEKFLAYAFVPWAFFGMIFLPITGAGFFGDSSFNFTWLFPFTLLFTQAIFCAILSWQYRRDADPFAIATRAQPAPAETPPPLTTATGSKLGRRVFLEKGILAGFAILLTILSLDNLLSFLGAEGISNTIRSGSPYNIANAPAIFNDPRLAPLVDSEITANTSFYRVDIDLTAPTVDASGWSLTVEGTGSPKSYSLADLRALPSVDKYTTFECVSNSINGNLISTAKWSGVKLLALLQNAGGLPSGAQNVVFYSVDGYSVAIPVSKVMTDDSLLASAMNDAPLPAEHGYPLRAVIPGLYGMMSCKWINRIQVVDSAYQGYWQTRGYTPDAIINTLAFIRVPRDNEAVSLSQNNGSVILGGYAFAGEKGISKVEVSFDGGKNWQQAILKQPISNMTWTLWALDWHPATAGVYQVYARATDGAGTIQTSTPTSQYPNGATGYATETIVVTA